MPEAGQRAWANCLLGSLPEIPRWQPCQRTPVALAASPAKANDKASCTATARSWQALLLLAGGLALRGTQFAGLPGLRLCSPDPPHHSQPAPARGV